MSDLFYRAFEERHRGSIELIKSRLTIYLPFIEPFKIFKQKPQALDLGCGRGEWLELLQDNRYEVKGVDLDEGMLQNCHEKGLNVVQDDALKYIKDQETESVDIITAFHFVEHICFEDLKILISEAYRVLRPGGLLILETPNSENLLVGTSSFYMDPTHRRPIPAPLLSFVAEYAKFFRVKTLYLQEPKDILTKDKLGLKDVLEGVSYDYSIVSQKNGPELLINLFDKAFNREYGTRLKDLVQNYDDNINAIFKPIEQQDEIINSLVKKINFLEDVLYYQILIMRMIKTPKNIITKLSMVLRKFFNIYKKIARKILVFVFKILMRPSIKLYLIKIINRFPSIKDRIKQLAIRLGLINRYGYSTQNILQNKDRFTQPLSPSILSPRALRFYSLLKETEKESQN